LNKQIIINSGLREKRAAILVDNSLDDILFARDTYDQIVRNIYKARIMDVLPGMQAAFVDIGIEKNAFLHISDAFPLLNEDQLQKWHNRKLGIQHVLKPGQEIMVQVVKEPIGTKGPKVTCKVTLPGRYFVLLLFEDKIGISRRIDEDVERRRLKKIANGLRNNGRGLIVRTNAYQKNKIVLNNDYDYLINLWSNIRKNYAKSKAPALVYKDVELINLIVRDYLAEDVDKVVIDSKKDYDKLLQLADKIVPDLKNRIYHYNKKRSIFVTYGIEDKMDKSLKRKVWLNSGGYINFDTTEALVAIDVNTGKYIGKKNLQQTVFKTNMEAAREIARQLRLRDIGGIIIIDFIDMNLKKHQEEVLACLRDELDHDRTKTAVLGLTRLGLVEMTRKKVREGLGELFQKQCPYCGGTGRVLSETTMAFDIIRELKKVNEPAILIELHPDVASVLIGSGGEKLEELENELNKDIYIRGNNELHLEKYNIVKRGSKSSLKKLAVPVNEGEKYKLKITEKHANNPQDGIARLKGYIIIVNEGGHLVDQEVEIKINEATRTFALANLT